MEHVEDVKLNRVLQHQKQLQKQRRSDEQLGRTQQQWHSSPVHSGPFVHQSAGRRAAASPHLSPQSTMSGVSSAVDPVSEVAQRQSVKDQVVDNSHNLEIADISSDGKLDFPVIYNRQRLHLLVCYVCSFLPSTFVPSFVRSFISRFMQKLLDQFHKIWWEGGHGRTR